MYYYRNGNLTGVSTYTGRIPTGDGALTWGHGAGGDVNYSIQDYRTYVGRALSADEINRMYQNSNFSMVTINNKIATDAPITSGESRITIFNLSAEIGNNLWTVTLEDAANSNVSDGVDFIYDPIAPIVNTTEPTYNRTNNATVTFTLNATDNIGLANATFTITNSTGIVNQTVFNLGNVLSSVISIPVGLADSVYHWFWNIFDTAGNQVTTPSTELLVHINPPILTFVSPTHNSGDIIANRTIPIAVSIDETDPINLTYNIWNSTWSNVTTVSVITPINYSNINFTVDADGVYYYNVTMNDLGGLFGTTETRYITINTQSDFPDHANLSATPESPQTWSNNLTIQLNATWFDYGINGLDSVRLVFNGTEYIPTNISSVYSVIISGLKAGTYEYHWYGNDTAGTLHVDDSYYYVINPVVTTTTLTTSPTSPATYGNATNFSCSNNILPYTMYINGIDRTNESGLNIIRGAGTYNINCSAPGNENITGQELTTTYVIDKAVSDGDLTATPISPITYGSALSTFTCNNNMLPVTLTVDGQDRSVDNGVAINRSARTYFIECTATGNENITGLYRSMNYTINKVVTQTYLTLMPLSPQNYSVMLNATCSASTMNDYLSLTRNGISVLSENSKLVNLSIGTYTYNCSIPGNDNYTYAENISVYNVVDPGLPNITVYSPTQGGVYTVNEDKKIMFNITASPNVTLIVYSVDGNANVSYTAPLLVQHPNVGAHSATICAVNNIGTSCRTITYTLQSAGGGGGGGGGSVIIQQTEFPANITNATGSLFVFGNESITTAIENTAKNLFAKLYDNLILIAALIFVTIFIAVIYSGLHKK